MSTEQETAKLSQGPSDEDLFGAPPFREWAEGIAEKQFGYFAAKLATKLEQAWKQGRRAGRREGASVRTTAVLAIVETERRYWERRCDGGTGNASDGWAACENIAGTLATLDIPAPSGSTDTKENGR